MLRMDALKWTTCQTILAVASIVGALLFQGVTCQNTTTKQIPNESRGDNTASNPIQPQKQSNFPEVNSPTPLTAQIIGEWVMCVDKSTVHNKAAVKLKLKTPLSCEEHKEMFLSVIKELCNNSKKLELYQEAKSDEMIISGECVEDDPKGIAKKFNDNIKDQVGILEVLPVMENHSQTVLIAVLLTGLLLAAVLIAAFILKAQRRQAKGMRLAEEMYQVDEQNQGNTLLSVAPLPPQEPVEKLPSNGESVDSPPTNGHSATQTPVADS